MRRMPLGWWTKKDTKMRSMMVVRMMPQEENPRSVLQLIQVPRHEGRDEHQANRKASRHVLHLHSSPTLLRHLPGSPSQTPYLRTLRKVLGTISFLEDRNRSKALYRLLSFHPKHVIPISIQRHRLNRGRAGFQSPKLAVHPHYREDRWPD